MGKGGELAEGGTAGGGNRSLTRSLMHGGEGNMLEECGTADGSNTSLTERVNAAGATRSRSAARVVAAT